MSIYPRSYHVTRGLWPVQSGLRTPGSPGLRANQAPNGVPARTNVHGEPCSIVGQMKDRDQREFCKAHRIQIFCILEIILVAMHSMHCFCGWGSVPVAICQQEEGLPCRSRQQRWHGKNFIQPGDKILASINESHRQHCTRSGLILMRSIALHACGSNGIISSTSLYASKVRDRSRLGLYRQALNTCNSHMRPASLGV